MSCCAEQKDDSPCYECLLEQNQIMRSLILRILSISEYPSAVHHKDGMDWVNLNVLKHDLQECKNRFDGLEYYK